jgi:hypothetical protein
MSSREIKAPRAWYKPLGVMIPPDKVESINFETKVLGVYLDMDGRGFHKLRLSDFELMWPLGIIDQDETVLYSGDIVKTIHTRTSETGDADPFANVGYEEYEKIGVLEYYHGYQFGPRLRWKKGHMMIPNTSTLWRMKAKRLGNIYEHPYLLGERGDSLDERQEQD